MSEDEIKTLLDETKNSLERMQTFDVNDLPREKILGSELNFKEVLPHATKLVNFYKQLSLNVLEDLPDNHLNTIKSQADADFTRFEEILNFSTGQPNPNEVRNRIIKNIENAYQAAFDPLYPLISYSTSKSADFKRLEAEARSTMQTVKDQGDELTKSLEANREEAEKILVTIRQVAAEQGVSQQSIYFKEEADLHEKESENWRNRTIKLAWFLGIYAFITIFFHKVPFLAPENTYQTIQIAISKVLVFAVISFMLYLSARNFLSHKHNSIVNKHRHTALVTYKALVDAAKETENQEIILTHASACIFSPQPTGYSTDSGTKSPSAKSVIELLNKPLSINSE